MKTTRKLHLKPHVIVTLEEVERLFGVFEAMRSKSLEIEPDKKYVIGDAPVVRVELTDEREHTVSNADELKGITTSRGRLIKRIRLSTRYGAITGSLSINRNSYLGYAADGDFDGDESLVDDFHDRCKRILDQERDLFLKVLSLPALIQAAIVSFILVALFVPLVSIDLATASRELIAAYLATNFLIGATVMTIISAAVVSVKSWVGHSIFAWGAGERDYENKKRVVTYALFTLPVAIAIKLLI